MVTEVETRRQNGMDGTRKSKRKSIHHSGKMAIEHIYDINNKRLLMPNYYTEKRNVVSLVVILIVP